MDIKYLKNIDPRPRRRHNKDNPYSLFTVGIDTEMPCYYISFIDTHGERVCIEIEKPLYDLFDKFELEDLSYLNEVDRHYERSELTDITLNRRTIVSSDFVDDVVMLDSLHNAIEKLPQVQKKRILLYYFEDMTLEKIAEHEGCSVNAVSKSIASAKKSLKNFLTEG